MTKLFGDIEKLEMNEMKEEIEIWNHRNNMNNAYTERRTLEIEKQAELRKNPARKSSVLIGSANGNVDNVHGSPSATAAASAAADSVVLRMIHPQEEKGVKQLHRECIHTSGDITIEHLKKFLNEVRDEVVDRCDGTVMMLQYRRRTERVVRV